MELESRGSGALDQRTVTVCSGLDLVNITYNNFVAADEKSAAVCQLHVLCSTICMSLYLLKIWQYLIICDIKQSAELEVKIVL